MASPDLQEIHDLFVKVAHKADTLILAASSTSSSHAHTHKNNSVDLVTHTDKAIEGLVSSTLLIAHLTFSFLGEETYSKKPLTDNPTLIIDPIDGTTNFIHSHPSACISLGLTIKKEPVVGVIFNPFLGELYSAIKGRGAFLSIDRGGKEERRKLPLVGENLGPLKGLGNALVAAEWGSSRDGPGFELKSKVFLKLLRKGEDGVCMVRGLRSSGSAAMNIAMVAAGNLDLYWEDGGCWAWDVCAGWCILMEVEGIMVGCEDGDWEVSVEGRRYMAVRPAKNGEGQREIVEEMWGIVGSCK